MNAKRKRHLIWILIILTGVSVATGLILYSLRAQTDYFYAPAQLAAGEAPENKRIRAGGMVAKGSVQKSTQNLDVSFSITDFKATVPVRYTGILPDLFAENSGIVATGQLENGVFVAESILAKHDENYMPPEVTAALKAQGRLPSGGMRTADPIDNGDAMAMPATDAVTP
jgi:cytochrome c-type biogenesis protein CcmE